MHRCPSNNCRGQFFLLHGFGVVCSIWIILVVGTDDPKIAIPQLEAFVKRWKTWFPRETGAGL
jgi:hypothetical protein